TFDGPLGQGAGFLVSARSGLQDVIAPHGESSYLRGATTDGLAKLEWPALGGRLRVLGYANENDISASASAETGPAPPRPRNAFEWDGRSYGAEWQRAIGGTEWSVRA